MTLKVTLAYRELLLTFPNKSLIIEGRTPETDLKKNNNNKGQSRDGEKNKGREKFII